MKKFIFIILVIIGAVILNSVNFEESSGFSNVVFKDGLIRSSIQSVSDTYELNINEMDEEQFTSKLNELSNSVATDIDFNEYQCTEGNTNYFFSDGNICLSDDDIKSIIVKTVGNISEKQLKRVIDVLKN